jgi:serine protease Do
MLFVYLRQSVGLVFLAWLVSFGFPGWAGAQEAGDFLALQRRVTDIYEQQVNAVVRVKAAVEELDEKGEPIISLRVGTGFFISREGHVLTNASVGYNATRVWIELNGVQYAADNLGSDPETNLSLLQVMVLPDRFSHIAISGNLNMPAIGSSVVAITCPLEFEPSPSLGIVAGHESQFSQRVFPVTYVRINIPANPGEGGAPVLDLNGRLVGIMVASLPEVRSSYILPARAIQRVRDDLLFSGRVEYGWIGMELDERVDRRLGRHIVVERVIDGTPAAEVGLQAGDRLVRMGETEIRRADDVRNANFYHRIGDFIDVQVRRAGETYQFAVRMIARPEGEGPGSAQVQATPLRAETVSTRPPQ